MNDNIELQVQIVIGLIALAGLGAGAYKIWGGFKIAVKNAVDENFKAISESIADINAKVDKSAMESCKNFLVRCLADIDRGDALTETESQRFKEQYDYYLQHGGNTYIKDKYEKSKLEGKL